MASVTINYIDKGQLKSKTVQYKAERDHVGRFTTENNANKSNKKRATAMRNIKHVTAKPTVKRATVKKRVARKASAPLMHWSTVKLLVSLAVVALLLYVTR